MKYQNIFFWTVIISSVLLIVYGIYKGFETVKSFDFIAIILGLILTCGIVFLLISIIIEQEKEKKKINNEINKRDLKP